MSDGLWIILIGALVASSCALVGCFLVLRRLSMLGDAISHAVLPGIVLAFFFSGSRDILPMMIGAGAMGLLTAWLTDVLSRFGKLQNDAAMGVTFTWLFAIGVILVSRFTGQVDLDVDCVLYGEIEYAPFTPMEWMTSNGLVALGPRAVWLVGFMTLANLAFVVLGYKYLKVCAFDSALAASMGINVTLWHYVLMGFVSATTVAAFESVGAVLVVAMLIVPPNTAYLLTDRLSHMLILSVLIGALSSVLGYGIAYTIDGSTAAGIAVAAGFFHLLAVFFAPRYGVLVRFLHRPKWISPEEQV